MMWKPGYKINKDSFSGEAKHRRQAQFSVYTDGSRQNGCTGSGLVIYKGKRELYAESYRLPDTATVFQAEVKAIAMAAEVLHGLNPDDMKFVKFFVDSQAAILALDNPKISSETVREAVEKLNQLADRVRLLQIVWIPAHKGYDGNERADVLAKRGAALPDGMMLRVAKPRSSIKCDIKDAIYAKWEQEWKTAMIANHAKSFYGKPDPNKAKYVYKLARLELGRFVRIITGHNNLNFFQAKLGLATSPVCRLCNEGDETITHMMTDCPALMLPRHEILQGRLPLPDMEWSVRKLLDFSYYPSINEAFERSTGGDLEEEWDGLSLLEVS